MKKLIHGFEVDNSNLNAKLNAIEEEINTKDEKLKYQLELNTGIERCLSYLIQGDVNLTIDSYLFSSFEDLINIYVKNKEYAKAMLIYKQANSMCSFKDCLDELSKSIKTIPRKFRVEKSNNGINTKRKNSIQMNEQNLGDKQSKQVKRNYNWKRIEDTMVMNIFKNQHGLHHIRIIKDYIQ